MYLLVCVDARVDVCADVCMDVCADVCVDVCVMRYVQDMMYGEVI